MSIKNTPSPPSLGILLVFYSFPCSIVMNNQQDWTCAASQILKLSPSCIDDIERGGNDSLKKEIESLWNLETKDPFIVSDCVGMFYYAVCLVNDGVW